MSTFITLAKLTCEGAKEIKSAPMRMAERAKHLEAHEVKTVGFYLTLGDYDCVWIFEAPNDRVAATVLLKWAAEGHVSTQTLKAFTAREFAEIVQEL